MVFFPSPIGARLPCACAFFTLSRAAASHLLYQTNACAYLLVGWRCCQDVVHQYGDKLGYSIHARRKGAVRRRCVDDLAMLLGLVQPLAGYRVYDIQHTQLVGARCLFEVRIELLDKDGLGLFGQHCQHEHRKRAILTRGP